MSELSDYEIEKKVNSACASAEMEGFTVDEE